MRSAVFVAAASALLACTVDPASTSSTTQNVSTKNRLASNRLASNRLAANMVTAQDLLSTSDGRTVYSYFVGCAVPAGTTIVADVPGAQDTTPDDPFTCVNGTCEFAGGVGIAPEWLTRGLS